MTGHSFVSLPGSERGSLPGSQELGAVDESQQIEVTLVTRRRTALPRDLVEGPATLTSQQFAGRHGTDPADLELITTVLARQGLEVTSADAGARRVMVRGTLAALSATFGATLRWVRSPDPVAGQNMIEHRYREGGLQIPAELNGIVLAVLGLDDRPQARAQFRRAPAVTARAGAPAPTPPAPAPGPHRARAHRGASRGTDLLHPAGGGHPLPVPGGHRRDWRRQSPSSSSAAGSAAATSIPTSPGWACRSPRSPRPAWTAPSTSPARILTARTARSCWTSRWLARWPRGRRRSSTSPPTPTRASWTR